MRIQLDDGRIFNKEDILSISIDASEPIYSYELKISSQEIKSSKGHKWMIWNDATKTIELKETQFLDINTDYLITQAQGAN